MTFTLSGSVITQAATDANLSGLAALAGVTVSTQQGYTVYNIGDRQLNIGGTLTIDPEIEMLFVGYDGSGDLMTVTGNLTIGRAIVYQGVTRYCTFTLKSFNSLFENFLLLHFFFTDILFFDRLINRLYQLIKYHC
jgi:hypothetical protein